MPLFKSDLTSDRGICNSVSHKGFNRNKQPRKTLSIHQSLHGDANTYLQTQNYWSFKSPSFYKYSSSTGFIAS